MPMKKLFTSIHFTWKKTILFAIIAGVYTGIMAMLPIVQNTSFWDITSTFEWWILFAIILIMNSTSNKDAALKCLVFFLISQPLVYLVQVPFSALGFGIFVFYKGWFIWTLFTPLMAYIGYYMKKDNLWGLLILSPMLVFLGVHAFNFLGQALAYFPRHFLSFLFCGFTMFLYVACIFSHKRERRLGFILCTVILIASIAANFIPGLQKSRTYDTVVKYSSDELYFDDTYRVYLEDEKYGNVHIIKEDIGYEEAYGIAAEFSGTGKTTLVLEDDTHRYVFDLDIGVNTYDLELIEP